MRIWYQHSDRVFGTEVHHRISKSINHTDAHEHISDSVLKSNCNIIMIISEWVIDSEIHSSCPVYMLCLFSSKIDLNITYICGGRGLGLRCRVGRGGKSRGNGEQCGVRYPRFCCGDKRGNNVRRIKCMRGSWQGKGDKGFNVFSEFWIEGGRVG